MSDADEYPAMMDMHARCVSIIADLWGAKRPAKPIGTATTGSSEAIHLGGLAMKRRWQEKRDKEGKDKSKPNIIMGANAQVALEKVRDSVHIPFFWLCSHVLVCSLLRSRGPHPPCQCKVTLQT